MTIFFAAISKRPGAAIYPRAADLADFLPLEPKAVEERRTINGLLIAFRWQASLDRSIEDFSATSFALLVGNPVFPQGHTASSLLSADMPALNYRMRGGYSGVVFDQGRMQAFASLSADFPVFVRETDDLICVSNRFALLLAVGKEPELDQAALGSIVSNGYVYGPRTTHVGISRLGAGDVVKAGASGFSITKPPLGDLFAPLEPSEAFPLIEEGIASAIAELASVPIIDGEDNTVPLSGGKDSRAIAGMLKASGNLGRFRVFTNGNLYSPEVLSAADVAAFLGSSHDIKRPNAITSGGDILTRVSGALLAGQGQLSMFDHAGTASKKGVNVGGHQMGLRDSYFIQYDLQAGSPPDIAAHLAQEVLIDGHNLLATDAREAVRANLESICADLLARGVPVNKMPAAFMWAVRLTNWVATINSAANVGQNTVNPLLNIDLMRLAYGLPDDIVAAEVIHFIIMSKSVPGLADVPFADQNWSAGLDTALTAIGWTGARPKPVQEYRSSPYLPNASNPYLPNFKLATYKILSRFVAANLDNLSLPWLDLPSVKVVCRPDAPQTVSRAISSGGVFTSVLWTKYGRNLLRRSAQDKIGADLQRFISEDDTPPVPTLEQQIQLLQQSLEAHEAAIGKFISAERRTRVESAVGKKSVAKKFRHVDITNQSDHVVSVWFEMDGGRKTSRRDISPRATFSFGLVETGVLTLKATIPDGAEESHPIVLRDDQMTTFATVGVR